MPRPPLLPWLLLLLALSTRGTLREDLPATAETTGQTRRRWAVPSAVLRATNAPVLPAHSTAMVPRMVASWL